MNSNIHIHERALRIVFKNFSMCFEGLIAKDKSITIYNRNQQQLVIGIFKGEMGISPILMTEMWISLIVMKKTFSFIDSNSL